MWNNYDSVVAGAAGAVAAGAAEELEEATVADVVVADVAVASADVVVAAVAAGAVADSEEGATEEWAGIAAVAAVDDDAAVGEDEREGLIAHAAAETAPPAPQRSAFDQMAVVVVSLPVDGLAAAASFGAWAAFQEGTQGAEWEIQVADPCQGDAENTAAVDAAAVDVAANIVAESAGVVYVAVGFVAGPGRTKSFLVGVTNK